MKEKKKETWWGSKTTLQKSTFVISIISFLVLIALFFFAVYSRVLFGDEVGDIVLGEGIENGWVWLANMATATTAIWVGTFVVIIVAFAIVFVANFFIYLFTFKGRRKGKTIGSLIRSLIKIVVAIVAISIILIFWGVDVSGILASVGVLTLIIGLGCQTLIQDVISGLFIVFDDYFGVGDIVIIDGFRGTVMDFGLKTTKLVDLGGNIKSISNSSITTVVNLSRIESVVALNMPIAYDEDLVRVEGVIVNALEKIKESIPNITEGPIYKGVSAVTDSSVNLLVICKCSEADRYQVTRDLTRELYLLFNENNILIPYNQIVVNPQNEVSGLKANDVEKLLSKKANDNNRGFNKKEEEKKKKGLKKMVKESLDEAASDIK